MIQDHEITIRSIKEEDLPILWELAFKDESPEWKKWDAPYYSHQALSYEKFLENAYRWQEQDDFWLIEVNGVVCGTVSYYIEDKTSFWIETGIILYEAPKWGNGIGTRVFRMWFNHLFQTLPIVRIGFTTWSGNKRMMRVGEKLGMTLEARIRKVRYYDGNYYDSIRMGILREEWEQREDTE